MDSSNLVNERYAFDGYTNTIVMYDKQSNLWKMTILDDPHTNATAEVSNFYPLGTFKWKIASPGFNDDVSLSMYACDDLKHYNCYDGSCIHIDDR
jgi:hypothetical protein